MLFDILWTLFFCSYCVPESKLRQSIKKTITEQSKFLHSIGMAHMQQELESRVLTITKKKSDLMEKESGVEPSMTENEIKDYIELVTKEIHKSRPNND
jgi:uncharacterized Fe-S cluster-containing radical SAM superfamily protein